MAAEHLRDVGDRQVAAHREVHDRRRHVLGVRRLIEDQAELRGLEPAGRLELDHHRLVPEDRLGLFRRVGWCGVVPRQVGLVASVDQPEADDQADAREQHEQAQADCERVYGECVMRELAVAGLEQRRRDVDHALDAKVAPFEVLAAVQVSVEPVGPW